MKKRFLSLILAVLMAIGTPVAVLASEAVPAEPIELVVEEPVEELLPEEPVAEEEQVIEEPLPEEILTEQAEVSVEEEVIEETIPEEGIFEGEWEETTVPEDIDLPENDRLLDAYVQQLLDKTTGSYELEGTLAGSRLSGLSKYFYDCLKSGIVQVANGELESTQFVNTEGWAELDWTAQDLGVAAIVENGSIPQAVLKAAGDKAGELIGKAGLMRCLLADCPAELYWFDKTVGMQVSYKFGATYTRIYIKEITFSFAVSADYKAGDNYTVKADKVNAAKGAIGVAKEIVEAFKDKTDVQKLVAYKNIICDLADYNHSAAGGSGSYGNPWQLVYVFDNNTSTKVVCEGYAKAFQYLCDLSTFTGDVTCYSVTGTMSGGTGAGPHMWNIVEINGDRWLVDITNCDAGSIGAPDKLFLVGCAASNGGATYKFTQIGGSTITYTYDADMQGRFCNGYPVLTVGKVDLGNDQPGGDQPGGDQPGGNEPEIELPDIEITVADGEIALDQDYIMLKQGDTVQLNAIWNGNPDMVTWRPENPNIVGISDVVDYTNCTITAIASGTAFVTVCAETAEGEVTATCRVDVISADPTAAHLAETTLTSYIFSTNYPTVELIFDIPQNMMSEGEAPESSIGIESVEFVDEKTAEMFGIKAIDDRTLAVIPLIDPDDAAAVKAMKSSYKSAVAVTLANGDDFITPEVLSVKVDKKLPTVKANAVKFNSFYSAEAQPLVFTSKNGEIVDVKLDPTPKGGVACPNWLTLNEEDMTLSLKGSVTKASGTVYLAAYVEGYSAPVKVTAKVTAASTAPKVKLTASKVTFNVDRNKTQPVQIGLISGDSKVAFRDIGITGVSVPSPYKVADYNAETGIVTLDVIQGKAPVKGKIPLTYSVEGTANKGTITFTADVYAKVPTVKLAKTSATLNPNLKGASSAAGALTITQIDGPAFKDLTVTRAYDGETPDGACIIDGEWVSNSNVYLSLIASYRAMPFSAAEAQSEAKFYIPMWKEDGLQNYIGDEPERYIGSGMSYESMWDSPYILFLHMDKNMNYVGYSQFYIGGTGAPSSVADAFSTNLVVTPADYVINPEDVTVEVLNGKTLANNELTVNYANGVVTVATNGSTKGGASYKVNFYVDGIAKPVAMTVKTVAPAKSQVKLAVSAKGKIVTGDPYAEIVITPKWTNYGGNIDLSENLVVRSTMKGMYTNKDITSNFVIWANGDGTYTLRVKSLEAMEKIHPKAAITVGVEGVKIGTSVVPDPKPVKLSITMTKAKVNQSTKNVTLYPNDKYSTGVVALSLKETNVPDIAYVRISETSSKPSAFKLEDLGNGMYAIGFKNNKISKAGSVKLEVFLEGNDPANAQPNATVSVSVKLSKFKAAK